MRVVSAEGGAQALNDLVTASQSARSAAAEAIARSQALQVRVRDAQQVALAARLGSRRHRTYARVEGVVEELRVAALVRDDGGVVGDRSLLRRTALLVRMGEEFDSGRIPATVGDSALASTLTLIRACDRVLAVELVQPGPGRLPA